MRATLAATYLDRGRVADAVPHLDQAVALDPSFVAAHLLRGLAHARLNRTAAAAAAYAARAKAGACVGPRGVSVSQRHSRGGAERGAGSGTGGVARRPSSGSHRAPTTSPACRSICSTTRRWTRRSSCRRPTSTGFRLLAQARYPEALASLRAAAAADPLVTSAARPTALNPADERARIAKADALVASGDRAAARASLLDTVRRLPGLGPGALASGPAAARTRGDQAARAAAVRSGGALRAGGGRVDRLRGDRAAAAHRARSRRRRARLRAPRRAGAAVRAGASRPRRRVSGAGPPRGRARRVPGGGAGRPRQRAALASAGQLRADLGDDAGRDRAAAPRRAARRQPRRGALRARPGAAARRPRRRVAAGAGRVRAHPEGRDGGAAAQLRGELARARVGAA